MHRRPLGLRQIDHTQYSGRVGRSERRRGDHGRSRGGRPQSRSRRGVPGPRFDAVADRQKERRVCGEVALARCRQGQDRRNLPALSRHGRFDRRRAQEAGGTLRRHEAARRHCARVRDRAQDAVARRAVRRARRADARRDPGRASENLRGDASDRVHDYARCRRSDSARRQDHADVERPARVHRRDRRQHAAARPQPQHDTQGPAVLPDPQSSGRFSGEPLEGIHRAAAGGLRSQAVRRS